MKKLFFITTLALSTQAFATEEVKESKTEIELKSLPSLVGNKKIERPESVSFIGQFKTKNKTNHSVSFDLKNHQPVNRSLSKTPNYQNPELFKGFKPKNIGYNLTVSVKEINFTTGEATLFIEGKQSWEDKGFYEYRNPTDNVSIPAVKSCFNKQVISVKFGYPAQIGNQNCRLEFTIHNV